MLQYLRASQGRPAVLEALPLSPSPACTALGSSPPSSRPAPAVLSARRGSARPALTHLGAQELKLKPALPKQGDSVSGGRERVAVVRSCAVSVDPGADRPWLGDERKSRSGLEVDVTRRRCCRASWDEVEMKLGSDEAAG